MRLGDIRSLPYPDDIEVVIAVQGLGTRPVRFVPEIVGPGPLQGRWAGHEEAPGDEERLRLVALKDLGP